MIFQETPVGTVYEDFLTAIQGTCNISKYFQYFLINKNLAYFWMCILSFGLNSNPKFKTVFLQKNLKNDLFFGFLGVYLPLISYFPLCTIYLSYQWHFILFFHNIYQTAVIYFFHWKPKIYYCSALVSKIHFSALQS